MILHLKKLFIFNMSIITAETDMKFHNFPKEICSIISKYCSTFLIVCIDILPDILPLLDCFTLHMVQHMTPETYNIISKYPKYNPKYTMLKDLIKYRNSGYIEVFNSLLQNKDILTQLQETFMFAIIDGNNEIVRIILELPYQKFDITQIEPDPKSGLHIKIAIECNYPEIVKLLVEDKRFDITLPVSYSYYSYYNIEKSVVDSLKNKQFKIAKLLEERRIKLCSNSRENIIKDFLQKYPEISELYKNLNI